MANVDNVLGFKKQSMFYMRPFIKNGVNFTYVHTTNIYWMPATILDIGKITVENKSLCCLELRF